MLAKFLAKSLSSVSDEAIIQKLTQDKTQNLLKEADEKKNLRKRKVSKRRALTRPKSPPLSSLMAKSQIKSSHESLNPFEISNFESMLMAAAEAEQTQVDRFWGMDEEKARSVHETELMFNEDRRSIVFETFVRTSTLINEWEEEEFLEQQKIGLKMSIVETMAQQNYLHAIYDGSLVDVSSYRWPTRPVVVNSAPEERRDNNARAKKTRSAADDAKVGDAFLRSLYSIESQAGFPLEASTIHTEGRQRTQILVANRAAEMSLTGTAAASRMLSRSLAGSSAEAMLKNNEPTMANGKEDMSEKLKPGTSTINAAETIPRLHYSALDGHPTFKWDQEAILRHVFEMFDRRGRGLLNFSQLARGVNDRAIYNHLKFTVLGAWVKLRLWDMFLALFLDQQDSSGADKEEHPGEVDMNSGRTLTLADLISGCRAAVFEDAVMPRQVRTQDEHRRIVMSAASSSSGKHASFMGMSGWEDLLQGGLNRAAFAESARQLLHRSQRDTWLLREVRRGDLVWGLYSGACEWLPAVVNACNEDGTLDLQYLITEVEILDARKATVARKLLFVSVAHVVLDPLEAESEMVLAGRVFDIIDGENDSSGMIRVDTLIDQLCLMRFERVVRSSAALSLLVRFDTFDFRKVLTDYAFSTYNAGARTRESVTEETAFISRIQFVEFCSVLSDIRSFNFS